VRTIIDDRSEKGFHYFLNNIYISEIINSHRGGVIAEIVSIAKLNLLLKEVAK